MAVTYTWPSRRDGGDGHKHLMTGDESRTLCGQRCSGSWIRGELEAPEERCARCDAAAVNSATDPLGRPAPVGSHVGLRARLRKAMSRADWAMDAYWSAETDDQVAIAAARVRETAAEVDALYAEFRAELGAVAGALVAA